MEERVKICLANHIRDRMGVAQGWIDGRLLRDMNKLFSSKELDMIREDLLTASIYFESAIQRFNQLSCEIPA